MVLIRPTGYNFESPLHVPENVGAWRGHERARSENSYKMRIEIQGDNQTDWYRQRCAIERQSLDWHCRRGYRRWVSGDSVSPVPTANTSQQPDGNDKYVWLVQG